MGARSPYTGPRRKLLLAFDVGTTYSGISYSILEPGHVPEIREVTRYPGQDYVGGEAKIPSVLYYSNNGKVEAVGAEARLDTIIEQALEYDWSRAECFKLHLQTKSQSSTELKWPVPPLPHGKNVFDIFADFYQYLLGCASSYIQETYDFKLWEEVKNDIHYALSHPNDWDEIQKMRDACTIAGLVPGNDAAWHDRLVDCEAAKRTSNAESCPRTCT
ncbi:hypothetical protein FA15DRAFT_648441 [Coprinopsis marcescibilis]|uniref:Actin-like ATPase domain-containing protein n=1 Tax=Coprinopsis marcescibilis TaxID=230819 RepID=A0A5C3KHI0_COPMA|nr:hypothetical protein FA15DRAFT_648441 [Coprinopsis marcescibilis]